MGNVGDNKRQFRRNSAAVYLPHPKGGRLPGIMQEDYVKLAVIPQKQKRRW